MGEGLLGERDGMSFQELDWEHDSEDEFCIECPEGWPREHVGCGGAAPSLIHVDGEGGSMTECGSCGEIGYV